MDYHYEHFEHVTTPQRLTFIDLLQNLEQDLAQILQEELEAGNAISQVNTEHWGFSLTVCLCRPFQRKYTQNSVHPTRSLDPHSAGEYYVLTESKQSLEAPLPTI